MAPNPGYGVFERDEKAKDKTESMTKNQSSVTGQGGARSIANVMYGVCGEGGMQSNFQPPLEEDNSYDYVVTR